MKKGFFFLAFISIAFVSTAQNCDNLFVDLAKGTLNGVALTESQETVKSKFPCFTGDSEDGGDFNCGGGVFYLNHDFFFYTGNDFLEVRRNFAGTISTPLLGLSKDEAIVKLGLGESVRSEMNYESEYLFFNTPYGCVRLVIENGLVDIVAMHTKPANDVILCL
jgi:hypothetical protein